MPNQHSKMRRGWGCEWCWTVTKCKGLWNSVVHALIFSLLALHHIASHGQMESDSKIIKKKTNNATKANQDTDVAFHCRERSPALFHGALELLASWQAAVLHNLDCVFLEISVKQEIASLQPWPHRLHQMRHPADSKQAAARIARQWIWYTTQFDAGTCKVCENEKLLDLTFQRIDTFWKIYDINHICWLHVDSWVWYSQSRFMKPSFATLGAKPSLHL